MRVPHSHGDSFMPHKLLQLHQRHLAGLSQPRCEGMSHGMQGDSVQGVTIFWGKIELSDGSIEASGGLGECSPLSGLSENRLDRLAVVRQKHFHHISRYTDGYSPATLGQNVKNIGIGIDILSPESENLRGTQTGFQGKQLSKRAPLPQYQEKCGKTGIWPH